MWAIQDAEDSLSEVFPKYAEVASHCQEKNGGLKLLYSWKEWNACKLQEFNMGKTRRYRATYVRAIHCAI